MAGSFFTDLSFRSISRRRLFICLTTLMIFYFLFLVLPMLFHMNKVAPSNIPAKSNTASSPGTVFAFGILPGPTPEFRQAFRQAWITKKPSKFSLYLTRFLTYCSVLYRFIVPVSTNNENIVAEQSQFSDIITVQVLSHHFCYCSLLVLSLKCADNKTCDTEFLIAFMQWSSTIPSLR